MIPFIKMHGLGNDFVIIDNRVKIHNINIPNIADRHFGVGCDQVIILETSKKADVFMRIYNANGSEASACGNATRCVAELIMEENGLNLVDIETISGILTAFMDNDLIWVNMGTVPICHRFFPPDLVSVSDIIYVSIKNKHLVVFSLDMVDIYGEILGNKYDLNVEFVEQISQDVFRVKVWERGVGFSKACGTGACAVFIAAYSLRKCGNRVEIIMDGGSLIIELVDDNILMGGPVTKVFTGVLC